MAEAAAEEEALFSYPSTDYYVQSPSTISHPNSPDCRNHHHHSSSPSPLQTFNSTNATTCQQHLIALSRYSSSRGSNNSFPLHHSKVIGVYNADESLEIIAGGKGREEGHKGGGDGDGDGDEDYEGRLLSVGYSSSWVCVSFQIVWRLVLSIGLALLVFFLVTRPPPPRISLQMGGIRVFRLGEGVDGTGVITKLLTSNCSIDLEVDNRSKFFGLHILPPIIDIAFGRFNFATVQGQAMYVESNSWETFRLYAGTEKKAMYGAGRAMEDLLQLGKGLPLVIHIRLRSNIQVVLGLIQPTFYHRAQCHLLLRGGYDKKHHTQAYNSTCTTISSH